MITYPYIEDYIEVIAGCRDISGKVNGGYLFDPAEPIINLARYDTKVIPNLAEQTLSGTAYTDRQAALALKLLATYERQLSKKDISVEMVKNPQFRMPIRQIDRSTRIWIEDDMIRLRYPFNTEMIDQMRSAAKDSNGQIRFNRQLRLQEADLTEWNINFCYSFAKQHNFEIDSNVQDLMDLILSTEKTNFKIELCFKNGQVSISNAEDSLIEYIEQHHGGITEDNLMNLVDLAPVFRYTISADIVQVLTNEFGERFTALCTNKQLKADKVTENLIADIVKYARAVNRFPIYVYEPDHSGNLLIELNKTFPDRIQILTDHHNLIEDSTALVIYTNRIPKYSVNRIPLLISTAGMMFGGDRQMWIQTAEKIVYLSKEVYNKNTKGTTICSII